MAEGLGKAAQVVDPYPSNFPADFPIDFLGKPARNVTNGNHGYHGLLQLVVNVSWLPRALNVIK